MMSATDEDPCGEVGGGAGDLHAPVTAAQTPAPPAEEEERQVAELSAGLAQASVNDGTMTETSAEPRVDLSTAPASNGGGVTLNANDTAVMGSSDKGPPPTQSSAPVSRGFIQQPPPPQQANGQLSHAYNNAPPHPDSAPASQSSPFSAGAVGRWPGHESAGMAAAGRGGGANNSSSSSTTSSGPAELMQIPYCDPPARSRLRFEVVTAKVIESNGKKHVSYTITMKRADHDPRPAVLERRYNDFSEIYERILRNFHPSVLGDFVFPKKVMLGNFKAEVITERTESFHKFLNLVANCDQLLYSGHFYDFLASQEHNEAVSYLKLARYDEAAPLLETLFYVREKLLTLANADVLQCLCELISTLHAVGRQEEKAFSYAVVAVRAFELARGHPDAEAMRVSFLRLTVALAERVGHDKRPYEKQLSELRYRGVKLENAKPLLELIRERYIHRTSHTVKVA